MLISPRAAEVANSTPDLLESLVDEYCAWKSDTGVLVLVAGRKPTGETRRQLAR